jgi:hypothetical protein
VGDRGTKEGHHSVADELLDPAAEALELGANMGVVGHQEGADVLGVEPLGRRREVDKVSK